MRLTALVLTLLILSIGAQPALAQTRAVEIETARYQACLDRLESDAANAFEDAMSWRMEGGGWPARHCEARALIALDDVAEAALMLQALAETGRFGPQDVAMRSSFWREAGDAWLQIEQGENALRAYQAGLALAPTDMDLMLGQAGALSALQNWSDLRDMANQLIDQAPYLAIGWRWRALAHLEMGALDHARSDILSAMERAPDDIDVLVLRGRILDALRNA